MTIRTVLAWHIGVLLCIGAAAGGTYHGLQQLHAQRAAGDVQVAQATRLAGRTPNRCHARSGHRHSRCDAARLGANHRVIGGEDENRGDGAARFLVQAAAGTGRRGQSRQDPHRACRAADGSGFGPSRGPPGPGGGAADGHRGGPTTASAIAAS